MNILVQNDNIVKINSPTKELIERVFCFCSRAIKEKIYCYSIAAQFEYPEWDIIKSVTFGYECVLQEVTNGKF